MRYLWAREHYKTGVANNWVPEEIPMQDDVEQWKSDRFLNETERRMIIWNLGFFQDHTAFRTSSGILALHFGMHGAGVNGFRVIFHLVSRTTSHKLFLLLKNPQDFVDDFFRFAFSD